MLAFIARHPRKVTVFLSLALFVAGFYREKIVEGVRVRALVESTLRADKDIQNLIFAYELRLSTVRALASYARKHKIAVPDEVMHSFDELDKPDTADGDQLRTFLSDQIRLTAAAKELIAMMDVDLPPTDEEFRKLFKEFQAEEESLSRIRQSYRQQTMRVRELARKGDRQFFSTGLHLPAAERM